MTLTGHRTFQYVGILLALAAIAAGYWYFAVRAGVKTNTSGSQPQGIGDLSAGLAGYWKLDENTGTSAADASTNAITALTLTNGPTWTTGQIGSAIDFDGTNDYATTPDNSLLEFSDTEDFTLSGWFNRDTATTDDSIAFKRNGVFSTNSGYSIYLDDATDQLIFGVSDNTDPYSVTSTTTFTSSGWHHFVAVWDQDSASGTTLYIDGVAEGTASGTIGSVGAIDGTQPFIIGAESDGDNPFDGKLDEIRVYDRVLSADEAVQLYRLTSPTSVDTSLKGYWSFDGGALSGTTAYDRSGAGNTGTLTNGPIAVDGKVGQALYFDGTDDEIVVPDNASLWTSNFTVSAWVKWDEFPPGAGDWSCIVCRTNGSGHNNYGLHYSSYSILAGAPNWNSAFDPNWSVDYVEYAHTPLPNTWYHAVTTYDNTTKAYRLYLDGVQVAEHAATNSPEITSGGYLSIGEDPSNPGHDVKGTIDEVRVYNRALAATEIKSLYDRGASDKTNTGAGQAAGTGNLNSGLLGYWKVDENTGTTVSDASVNGTTGTLTGGSSWATGRIGSAVDLDGTNDYVDLGTPAILDIEGAHTVSAWVKTDVANTDQAIFSGGTAGCCGTEIFLMLDHNGGGGYYDFQFGHGGSGYLDAHNAGDPDVQTGTWYHVVGTWDGVGARRFYVNGVLRESDSIASLVEYSDVAKIGTAEGGINYWNGAIDEVRVYDHALSADEVGQLYRLTAPTGVDTSLRGYWSFNGQDMNATTAFDRSGTGNDGTLTGGPTIRWGKVGQALSFDNVNDYVLAGSPTTVDNLETQGGGGMTASAWIYPESGGTFGGTIVGKRSAPSPGSGDWAFSMSQDEDAVKFAKSYSTTSLEVYSQAGSVVLNKWQYVTVTWSGTAATSSVQFYVDGVAVANAGGTAGVGTKDSDAANVISISSQFLMFDGLIDEVRLHNRILTAAEIKALYEAGAPDKTNTSAATPQGTGRLDSGLAGYWPLDNGSGTTATDTSTNANNGTLVGGPTWSTGRIGSAITFDGTNDEVDMGTIPNLTGATDTPFTWAFWAKTSSVDTDELIGWGASRRCRPVNIAVVYGIGCTVNSDEYGAGAVYSTSQVNDGQWHHIIYTHDSGRQTLYFDGRLESTGTEPFTTGASDITLATRAFGGYYAGQLDDVRVYSRALSADEAGQLYRLVTPTGTDTSLKGYWSFNGQDMTATTAYDRSGAGNDGTLTNGPSVKGGKIGQALQFDGTNDYVSYANNIAFNSSDFAVSAWVRRSGAGGGADGTSVIFSQRITTTGAGNPTVMLYLDSSHRPAMQIRDNVGSAVTINGAVATTVGQWTYLVAVKTSGQIRLYADGVEIANSSHTLSGDFDAGATIRNIGKTNYDSTDYGFFNGVIDEVRVYNRAPSASEIKSLYSSGK